jgi:dipeptidase E
MRLSHVSQKQVRSSTMRLYLSSHRFGDRFDLLLAMVGQGARAAVISNALDLASHGLDAADLDLRHYFGKEDALEAVLADLDLVWVTGGNAFLLRRAMHQSGFDRLIGPLLERDKLVYGGWSAGAVVASPSLRGMDLMDDPVQVAEGYDPQIIWDGLNLIAFHLVPHFGSGPDAPAAEKVTAYMLDQAMPYRTMQDGDVLVRDANGIKAYETA